MSSSSHLVDVDGERLASFKTGSTQNIETTQFAANPLSPHTDVAYNLYRESLDMEPAERERIAKRVLLKLDMLLLPMMCTVYMLSVLDKVTLNYANAYGLQKDLGLKGFDYSWVASITNFGYLFGAYPSTICLQKAPIGRFVGFALMLWGAILMLTVAVTDFSSIMTLRFLLGFAESGIGPAWVLITSMFWTRKEQPLRMCIWQSCIGVSQLLGAGVSWGLGHAHGALKPWQLIFLVVGAANLAFGVVAVFLLPSTPQQCVFFSHKEAVVAVWRISENRTGIKNTNILWYQAREAVKDPKVYLFAASTICIGCAVGVAFNFTTVLLKGFGFSPLKSLLYQMPGGAITIVWVILAGWITTTFRNSRCLVIVLGLIPPLAGMIGMATIPKHHVLPLAACSWLQFTIPAPVVVIWSLIAANVAGHTKRTFVNGLEFVSFAAGNIIGPFFFLPEEAPRYLTAIKTLAGLLGGASLFIGLAAWIMWRDNRKRRVSVRVEQFQTDEAGYTDHTDRENHGFVYQL